MKKFLTILAVSILSLLVGLYAIFLIAPSIINRTKLLDNFKPEIQKIVKENSKLNLDYSKINIFTTPSMSIGAEINDVNIFLDDNSSVFKTSKIKGGLAVGSLFTLTLKTSRIIVDEPQINLEIVDSKQYKVVKLFEEILNENAKKPQEIKSQEEELDLSWLLKRIRIKVPYVMISNYNAQVVDLNSKHKVSLTGDKIFVKYNGARNTLRFKTNAKVQSDDRDNILANLDVSVSTPKIDLSVKPQKEEVDPEEDIKIPFVNLVKIYQTYDLKANADAKLKVRTDKQGEHFIFGHFNVDDITLKLSNIQLPQSYFHSSFFRKDINFDTNIYATKDEKLSAIGSMFIGKHPRFETQLVSDEIHFSNLLKLLEGLLDSLNVKNDIAQIQANGYLKANAKIKTNFKKLTSDGQIVIKDGYFLHSKIGLGIRDLVANLCFDDNALNVKDTSLTINGSKLNISGSIDNKSNIDIKANSKGLSIPVLYNSFAPKELKRAYKITSALLDLNASLNGTIENPIVNLDLILNNLSLNDTKNTFNLQNSKTHFNLKAINSDVIGKLVNTGFKFNVPSAKIATKVENISVDIGTNDIKIYPFDFIYNNSSKINIKGNIINYLKNPNIDLFLDGYLSAADMIKTLGSEVAFYVPAKGNIPLKVKIEGDKKVQNVLAQIYADSNNFISPINLASIYNSPSLIQGNIRIKGNKIKIKDSGLYKKANSGFSSNLEQNILNSKQLVDFTTVLENGHINLLRINIPQELKGNIAVFKKSSFNTKGKILLNGDFDNLNYGGDLKVSNVDIPELFLKIKDIDLNFLSKALSIEAKGIDLNKSIINAGAKVDLDNFNLIKVSNINIDSSAIDVDKALEILPKLEKYMPPAKPASKTVNVKTADIPIVADGKFDIKKLTTGGIEATNIKGRLGIKKNNLIIDKLNCVAFEGNIKGNVVVNLISQLITVKLNGEKMNADKTLIGVANLKDTVTGTLGFKTDISLAGTTYEEQMKSLKGKVYFNLKNGALGPFSKLENFFLAENIRENPFFKNTIGVILNPLTTIDSSKFEEINGELTFKDGIAYMSPITTQGDILCVLVQGNMNLLTNEIDSSVRVRLASAISDMLGPLALANPINLVKNTPGLNVVTAKLFSFFTQVVEESEYKKIPDFSAKHSDDYATKFQIVLRGDVNKPLKLVKSFKWLALQKDMDAAKEFSDKYVKEQEQLAKQALIDELQKKYETDNKIKVGVEKVLQMDTTAPAVKELLMEEVTKKKQETQNKVQTKIDETQQQTQQKLDTIKDSIKENVEQKVSDKIGNDKATVLTDKLNEALKNKVDSKIKEISNTDKNPL